MTSVILDTILHLRSEIRKKAIKHFSDYLIRPQDEEQEYILQGYAKEELDLIERLGKLLE